jgi:hypothetical protein
MTALKTRVLGKSGIVVTKIGMGLWAADALVSTYLEVKYGANPAPIS